MMVREYEDLFPQEKSYFPRAMYLLYLNMIILYITRLLIDLESHVTGQTKRRVSRGIKS